MAAKDKVDKATLDAGKGIEMRGMSLESMGSQQTEKATRMEGRKEQGGQ